MKAAIVLGLTCALGLALWLTTGLRGAPPLRVENALAQPLGNGNWGAFLSIANPGAPDLLTGVSSPVVTATLYDPVSGGALPIPTGTAALALDAAHVVLTAPGGTLAHGSLVPLTLSFAKAGDITVKARLSDPAKAGRAGEVGLFGRGDICVVGDGEPAPAIGVTATPEGGGWRIAIDARDFTFSEDLMGLYHVPGMGHAHLYLGGMKLGRIFAPQAHIGALPPGRHEVRVTLNTNDHRAYVVDDVPVTASTIIEVD